MSLELTISILLVIGLAFMALEALAPSFGLLGLGGAASFFAALLMMRNLETFYGLQVEAPVLIALGLIGLAVLAASFYFVILARRRTVAAGAEIMVGMAARVTSWNGHAGNVHVDGESWAAQGPEGLAPGDSVTIAKRDNLVLTVTKGASQ